MLQAVCSVQTPKSVRREGTGSDLEGAGKGERAEERWEKSRSMRLRGEKQRGNGLTVSKRRWEKVEERVGRGRSAVGGHFCIFIGKVLSFCFRFYGKGVPSASCPVLEMSL